jgi:aminomethyltransferase
MLDNPYPKVRPGPPKPSTIIKPQVFSLPPGTERYVVAGCGAALIRVETGDSITITSDEGGQTCEIVAADGKGKIDPTLLGATGAGAATGLQALLTGSDQSLRGLRMGLAAR